MSVAFSYVNFLEDASPIIASSEQTNFPKENIIQPFRSKSWRSAEGSLTSQYLRFDCGYQVRPTAFFLVNEQRGIQLSPKASIQLQGCNDGNWTTPEVDETIDWHESLITKFMSPYIGSCRFWQVLISDSNNIENFLEIGNLFLGESVDFESTDVKFGWEDAKIDDSERVVSDGNEPWFDVKTQRDRWTFDLEYMTKAERDNLNELFRDVGQHKPFYLHLDPDLKISDDQSELTRYVRFASEPVLINSFYDAYSIRIVVEEAV